MVNDSDGRWSAEKFRGLMFQIDREANVIAKETRRGKGNFIITTSDVASALAMSGFLNLTPTPMSTLTVDDTGNTFAGTSEWWTIKVYIDPYSVSGADYITCSDIEDQAPMMLVCSTAHTFRCKWFVLSTKPTSNRRLASRPDTVMVNNPFVSGNGTWNSDRLILLPMLLDRTNTTESSVLLVCMVVPVI